MRLELRGTRYAPGWKPSLSRRLYHWLYRIERIGAWVGLAAVAFVGLWFTYSLIIR